MQAKGVFAFHVYLFSASKPVGHFEIICDGCAYLQSCKAVRICNVLGKKDEQILQGFLSNVNMIKNTRPWSPWHLSYIPCVLLNASANHWGCWDKHNSEHVSFITQEAACGSRCRFNVWLYILFHCTGHGTSFRVDCHQCSCFSGDTICSSRQCLRSDSTDEERLSFTGVCLNRVPLLNENKDQR